MLTNVFHWVHICNIFIIKSPFMNFVILKNIKYHTIEAALAQGYVGKFLKFKRLLSQIYTLETGIPKNPPRASK